MVEVNCYNAQSGATSSVDVDTAPFGEIVRKRLLRQAFLHYSAAHRQGTHSTLTRAGVNYNTRKPWRQKGTGRARSGDFASPLWRGGVVAHDAAALGRHQHREHVRVVLAAALATAETAARDQHGTHQQRD